VGLLYDLYSGGPIQLTATNVL